MEELAKPIQDLAVREAIRRATSEIINNEREAIMKAARRMLPDIIEELAQQRATSTEGDDRDESAAGSTEA